jgi:hypothetical protein
MECAFHGGALSPPDISKSTNKLTKHYVMLATSFNLKTSLARPKYSFKAF